MKVVPDFCFLSYNLQILALAMFSQARKDRRLCRMRRSFEPCLSGDVHGLPVNVKQTINMCLISDGVCLRHGCHQKMLVSLDNQGTEGKVLF